MSSFRLAIYLCLRIAYRCVKLKWEVSWITSNIFSKLSLFSSSFWIEWIIVHSQTSINDTCHPNQGKESTISFRLKSSIYIVSLFLYCYVTFWFKQQAKWKKKKMRKSTKMYAEEKMWNDSNSKHKKKHWI